MFAKQVSARSLCRFSEKNQLFFKNTIPMENCSKAQITPFLFLIEKAYLDKNGTHG
jgi:hypothetical protein